MATQCLSTCQGDIEIYIVKNRFIQPQKFNSTQKLFTFMPNLQTYYHFKLDFQKVDQHTGGKWLIHATECRKDNQLHTLELPCRIS